MGTPKRHHYLPDFFLRQFGDGERLAVFDRTKNECRIQSPRNIAVIGHYYTFEWDDGTRDEEIEKMLCDVEGKAKPIIESLDQGRKIDEKDRVNLGYFLALLITRVPQHEKMCGDILDLTIKNLSKGFFPTAEAVVAHFKNTSHAMSSEEAASFHRFVHDELYTVKRSRNEAIVDMIERARQVAPHIILMDWIIVHTTEEAPFVLSDAPLGFIVDENDRGTGEPVLGIFSERVIKVIPLNQNICLLMVEKECKAKLVHVSANEHEVDQLNTAVIQESERIVIGKDEKTVTEAVRKASPLPSVRSKMMLDEIPHPTDPMRSLLVMHRTQPGYEDIPLKLDPTHVWANLDMREQDDTL